MRRPLLTLLAAALALAGCGGDDQTTKTVTRTVTAPAATATSPDAEVPATSPDTPPPAETTTVPRGSADRCRSADLSIGQPQAEGAAGTIVLGFTLTNDADTPCTTQGYPGIALLSGAGTPFERTVGRAVSSATQSEPVTLLPRGSATFIITYANVDATSATCPRATGIRLIAPDDTQYTEIQFVGADRPTIPTCSTRIEVSPVVDAA